MDIRSSQAYYAFIYDPYLYGFNTAYWKELNGTASAATNKIRVNSVTIVSKHQYLRGKFIFGLTMASAPTVGQNKEFGLKSPGLGSSRNACYFQILGSTLNAIVIALDGTVTTTAVDSSFVSGTTWTTKNDFRILWNLSSVQFFINGVRCAEVTDRNLLPDKTTIPVWIANNNIDAEDVSYVEMNFVDQVVAPTWELPIVSPAGTTEVNIESTSDAITTTESTTANVSPPVSASQAITVSESVSIEKVDIFPSVSDSVTITESKTVNRF